MAKDRIDITEHGSALNFASYELEGLRERVRSILNVRGAIAQVVGWVAGLSIAVAVLSWLVFASRIDSTAILVLFVIGALVFAVPAGAMIGGWFLARRRLADVTEASGYVVDMVGDMHRDIVRVRAGSAQTSVRAVAVGLVEQAIFPIVFDTVNSAAEAMLGPAGFLVSRVTAGPMRLVERSVIAAIRSLPDRRLGEVAESAAGALQVESVVQSATARLAEDYVRIRANMTDTVAKVAQTSLRVAVVLTVLAFVPLVLWWLFAFVTSG